MKISNSSDKKITFYDLDRGIDQQAGIYETTNAKGQISVAAGESIHVFDTDRVMLSAELGQVKKMKDASMVTTDYSLFGNVKGTVTISSSNDELIVDVDGSEESIEVADGSYSMVELAAEINSSASGFAAEVQDGFLVLTSADVLTVVDGSMNASVGLLEGQKTLAK